MKNRHLVTLNPELKKSAAALAPRVVLLLDGDGLVVSTKSSLSTSGFNNISDFRGKTVHEFLHPDCGGACGFEHVWNESWSRLQQEDFVEWERHDLFLKKLLRFNLTRPPSSRESSQERRRRNALLTVKDITTYRKEHESLRQREERLVTLVRQQSIDLAEAHNRLENEGKSVESDDELMAKFEKNIRSLSYGVIMAQENERKRIASDLHDGIAQSLTMLKFSIEASIEKLQSEHTGLDLKMLEDIVVQTKGAVEEIRRISWNLAPTMLDDFGLQVAIEWLCKQTEQHYPSLKIECSLCVGGVCIDDKDKPNPVSIALYRVVQEGMNNAAKHAGASHIDVAVEKLDDGIELTISDDGSGFDLNNQRRNKSSKRGQGLRSMRERVAATDGAFDIVSAVGQGTTIRASWSEEALDLLID